MDQYQTEIRELRATLARLREADGDLELIDEYEAEVRNLSALYTAATETLATGRGDSRYSDALSSLGFGDWTLDNVYSYVYDLAMELPSDGRDLAALINETDFAGSLLESLHSNQL